MKILFYKHGRLICRADAAEVKSAMLLALHKMGWTWELQVQAG
jgi:hypothetical protein